MLEAADPPFWPLASLANTVDELENHVSGPLMVTA
jgi:hypothetical protein